MDHQTGWLVDDQEVRVLVKNGERQVLRLGGRGSWRRNPELDVFPASDALCRAPRSALHQNMAICEERLDSRPAELREHRHQRPVETFSADGWVESKVP
jgi:hypothetical protein